MSSESTGSDDAREVGLAVMRRFGFSAVVDRFFADGSWRGEFVGPSFFRDQPPETPAGPHRPEEIALWCQKHAGARFVSVGLASDVHRPESTDDYDAMLEIASDHDLALYFDDDARHPAHLSTRLFVTSLAVPDDVAFTIATLESCRAEIEMLDDRLSSADEARDIEDVSGAHGERGDQE